MKQAIHLIDPVSGKRMLPEYITLRCGMVRKLDDTLTTTVNREVTCIKCRSYINNPWRALRKYGKVKVLESIYAVVWGDYGYKFDIVAMLDVPGTWAIMVSHRNELHLNLLVQVRNMANLGFKLLEIYERQVIEMERNIQQTNPEPETLNFKL